MVPYVDIHDVEVSLRDILVEGRWNLDILYTPLPCDVTNNLQCIEPGLVHNRRDAWVWGSSETGCYSAKDGYSWLMERNLEGDPQEDWRWIWRLRIPERVRIFLWLVMQDAIQTNSRRFRCNMAASPGCTRCSAAEEDAIHCLRDYPHSREMWLRVGALSWPRFLMNGCRDWVRVQAQGRQGTRFVACLWGIWKWRNNMIFDDVAWSVGVAWRRLCHEHDDMERFLNTKDVVDDEAWMARRWKPPPEGKINLCTDGSFNPTASVMGSGGIIRDSHGEWVCGFQGFLAGGNALLSEARAMKIGLEVAWERGYREVDCNTDCSSLVQALEDKEKHQFFPILKEIKELIDRRWNVDVSVISRDCNLPADWLAKHGAASPNVDFCLLDVPPSELEILIIRDRLAVP